MKKQSNIQGLQPYEVIEENAPSGYQRTPFDLSKLRHRKVTLTDALDGRTHYYKQDQQQQDQNNGNPQQ